MRHVSSAAFRRDGCAVECEFGGFKGVSLTVDALMVGGYGIGARVL